MILELNHVALYVENVEKSMHFYQEVIGLIAIPRPAFSFEGGWLEIAHGQQLHLIGSREEEKESTFNNEAFKPRANHFALKVDDFLKVKDMLKAKGATFIEPSLRPDGAKQLFLQDPDGYWVELLYINNK